MFRSAGKEDEFSIRMESALEKGDAGCWEASKAGYRILSIKH
jgi:hypothetical protein